MRIKVVSDLHIEIGSYEVKNEHNYDLLILSGDILVVDQLANPYTMNGTLFESFLTQVSKAFPKVIYIMGNHEFYHGHFHKSIVQLQDVLGKFPNIYLLEKDYLIINDIAFIGGTLWTDCNNADPLTLIDLPQLLNDYRIIRNDKNDYKKLIPLDTMQRHYETLQSFKTYFAELKEQGITKFVVTTHHSPSFQGVTAEYKQDIIMNGGYHSNLEDFVLDNPEIILWTHGHTHKFLDYNIGNTRVVCNPRGYHTARNIEQTNWIEDLVIEI
jgi:Icc-related predicted phosphoesterase